MFVLKDGDTYYAGAGHDLTRAQKNAARYRSLEEARRERDFMREIGHWPLMKWRIFELKPKEEKRT